VIDWFMEPLQYPFMVRGLCAAILVGIVSAVTGTFVVLRGMAFFGNALAHSILPGVAAGYILGEGDRRHLFWWALGAAILSALGINLLSRDQRLKTDTAIGITYAGMFALGIVIISSAQNYTVDLTHILFGDILGVGSSDLVLTASFGLLVLLIHGLLYKEFQIMAFDPILAKTLRLPTRFLNGLQLVMIALVIVVSLQTVGIAMMAALLITPAATAYLVTRHLRHMIMLAVLVAMGSVLTGLYLSFYWNIASGAAIVLVATTIFVLAWLIKRK